MPEPMFKLFALDILQLHQQTTSSWFALPQTENTDETAVFSSTYAHLDGHYYFAVPEQCPALDKQNGIVLIEDEEADIRLSWIGRTREVSCKECVYQDACAVLQRRCRQSSDFDGPCRLLELCPEQGHLSISDKYDAALSPQLLQRALYPAAERLQSMAG
ncbi:MAG: hypothetical protein Q3966_04975 [Neisseria sp.]|nr:hypothetical protein [Neisseria sp.]